MTQPDPLAESHAKLAAILAGLESSIDPHPVGFVSSTLLHQERATLAAVLREALAPLTERASEYTELKLRDVDRRVALQHVIAFMYDKVHDLGGISAAGCCGAVARVVQHYQRYLIDIVVNPVGYVAEDMDPDETSPGARDWVESTVRKYDLVCGWSKGTS